MNHWPSDRIGGEMKKIKQDKSYVKHKRIPRAYFKIMNKIKNKTCLWTERTPDAYFPGCGKGLGWSGFGKTPGRAMFKFCPSCGLKIRHVRWPGV